MTRKEKIYTSTDRDAHFYEMRTASLRRLYKSLPPSPILLTLLLLLAACAVDKDFDRTDPQGSGSPATISLRISTPEANRTRSDREAHFYEVRAESENTIIDQNSGILIENPAGLDNELINSWWIAFVNQEGTVAKIINNTKDLEQNPTDEDSLDEFEMEPGTYMMYAFANISQEDLNSHTGLEFKVDNKLEYDLRNYVFSRISNYTDGVDVISPSFDNGNAYRPKSLKFGETKFADETDRPLIPMSGCQEVTITDGKLVSIEVKRMVSKMQIELKNTSKLPIQVKDVYIGRFRTGDIFLFEHDDDFFLPGKGFDLINGGIEKNIEYTKGKGGDLDLQYLSAGLYADTGGKRFEAKDQEGSTASHLFYLNESIANYYSKETETFFIEIKMTRITELATDETRADEGEDDDDDFHGVQPDVEQKIVIVPSTSENYFTNFRRNDYIVFPIEITDVVVDFIPSYYPPIGGYPTVKMQNTADYTEFFFEKGNGGFFSITPMVFADIKKTQPLAVEVEVPLYVYDSAGIFEEDKRPTCTDGTDITGTLSGKSGSSEINVRLRVTLVLDDGSTKVQTYVRRIKITVS